MSREPLPVTIRKEQPGDQEAIFELTKAAFAQMEYSDRDEHHLVGRLRDDGDLTLSLVALDGERIVGHIAFSPVRIIGEAPEPPAPSALPPGAYRDTIRVEGRRERAARQQSKETTNWFGLGPVSVWPELHHRGVGGELIKHGIADMRELGAKGIVLLGSNQYYPRFGFKHYPELKYPGPPPEFFQALPLDGEVPSGVVEYSRGFG